MVFPLSAKLDFHQQIISFSFEFSPQKHPKNDFENTSRKVWPIFWNLFRPFKIFSNFLKPFSKKVHLEPDP